MNVVFSRKGGLARVRADGSHEQRLVRRGMEPAWSPDGRSIVFSRGDALWTMRPPAPTSAGSPPQRSNEELYAPDWQSRPG